jgi:hypothetical protein
MNMQMAVKGNSKQGVKTVPHNKPVEQVQEFQYLENLISCVAERNFENKMQICRKSDL